MFHFTGHVLSDEFIENKVAKLIGDRWYELGIYLGWSISHMTGLHDQSSEKKGSLVSATTLYLMALV